MKIILHCLIFRILSILLMILISTIISFSLRSIQLTLLIQIVSSHSLVLRCKKFAEPLQLCIRLIHLIYQSHLEWFIKQINVTLEFKFLTRSRWCWCCWNRNQTLRRTISLKHFLISYSPPYSLLHWFVLSLFGWFYHIFYWLFSIIYQKWSETFI